MKSTPITLADLVLLDAQIAAFEGWRPVSADPVAEFLGRVWQAGRQLVEPVAVDLAAILRETVNLERGLAALLRPAEEGWSEAVHVTPITTKGGGLHQLAGKSLLVSYAYPEQLDQAVALVNAHPDSRLILDNGAFTAWTQGKVCDAAYWAGFYAWARPVLERCPRAVLVCPDVIGGTPEENLALIEACPVPVERRMVVWHLDEPLEHLQRLARAEAYVAFGSCGDFARLGTPAWDARINEAFDAIDAIEAETGRRPRLHMMRGLGQLKRGACWQGRRFDSADSSNVARNHCRHKGVAWHIGRFADRIEAAIPRGRNAGDQAAINWLLGRQAALLAGAAL